MQFSKLHILRHCLDMKINIEILKNFFREHYDPFFGESFFLQHFFLIIQVIQFLMKLQEHPFWTLNSHTTIDCLKKFERDVLKKFCVKQI